ncbi:flagellar basal body-associated protein FliL [Mesorhizobium sp. PAMC28654]|uniref:flagellar basal body-associated protein FliL n=1 Tax=Mesorhizobium sp. PAMC28654 TaxID=2880934 RepID=UPI001D0A1868|nr:flagellar basal body-associated protein FliL [Mesorhizobium sp. PAMC28654]UDL90477.1 flagellar basal body-associated protein FliL [Mesorhizobium sp. PAMC28654]
MAHESFSSNRINRSRLLALAYLLLVMSLVTPVSASAAPEAKMASLADATVLIIRHAEKPDSGTGLSPAGEARAQAYVGYFQHLTLNGAAFRPDTLIATADSKNSARERQTLEPLGRALRIPLDLRFDNKDIAGLVRALMAEPHRKSVLIAWHHGTLPQIIEALGGDPHAVLPDGYWPDNVFDAFVVLRYDHGGKFIPGSEQIIHEDFANPPGLIRGASSR